MSSSNSADDLHPLEMLEAYALAALEDDEWGDVDLHLAACPQCSLEVAQVQRATYLLSETVPRWEPPPGLRDRVMASLPAGGAETAPASGAAGLFDRIRGFATLSRLTRVLLPLAATLVLGLLTGAMFMNMVNTTEGTENAATEVATEAGEDLPLRSAIPSAGLLHFDPSTPPLVLHPPHGPDGRHGFMLIAEDGRRAMLMISGMEAPDPSWIYNVWLTRNGHRISLGPVQIDASGLATIEVVPPEPLFLFDAINVTMDKDTQEPGSPGQMILESKLAGRPLK